MLLVGTRAHGSRRGPYEARLLQRIKEAYGDETGLAYDVTGISRNMTGYYSFNWSRYRHATSPFTPSVIIELAFLSNDGDRDLVVNRPDVVAIGVANGILNFLDEAPRAKVFGEDLVIPVSRRPSPSPSAAP